MKSVAYTPHPGPAGNKEPEPPDPYSWQDGQEQSSSCTLAQRSIVSHSLIIFTDICEKANAACHLIEALQLDLENMAFNFA